MTIATITAAFIKKLQFNKFETIWKEMKYYSGLNSTSYVETFNCFMQEMEEHAKQIESDDFDPRAFETYLLSWRHSAKNELQKYCQGEDCLTPKQFCREVYESYLEEAPETN